MTPPRSTGPVPAETFDPYAPPAHQDEAPASAETLWQVEGDRLFVRNGARLPPVDLLGGGAGEETTPCTLNLTAQEHRGKSRLIASIPAILMAVVLIGGDFLFDRSSFVPAFLAFLVSNQLVQRFLPPRQTDTIRAFVSLSGQARRVRRRRMRLCLPWIGLCLVAVSLAGLFLDHSLMDSPALFFVTVAAGIGFSLAALAWSALDRGPYCKGIRQGWFHLGGIPPAALAELALWQRLEPPPLRHRKVFTFYQHRLPLPFLVGRGWTPPLTVLRLKRLQAIRSPLLEALLFHPDEIRKLPPPSRTPAFSIAGKRRAPAVRSKTGSLFRRNPSTNLPATSASSRFCSFPPTDAISRPPPRPASPGTSV